MPERMQLRNVPISDVEETSPELDMEAEWIYKHAFSKASISNQVNCLSHQTSALLFFPSV